MATSKLKSREYNRKYIANLSPEKREALRIYKTEWSRAWRKANPEKQREYSARYKPERKSSAEYMRRYRSRLTPEQQEQYKLKRRLNYQKNKARFTAYHKNWLARLTPEKKERHRAYKRRWNKLWRAKNPGLYSEQQKKWADTMRLKRSYEGTNSRSYNIPEEDLPGHCKRCGILHSERGTPDNVYCTPCHSIVYSAHEEHREGR